VAIAAALAAVLGWALFWPAPTLRPRINCSEAVHYPCIRVSGRIVFHTRFAPKRRAHLVLISRDSITLPGVVSIEFPSLNNQPADLSTGSWLSAIGYRTTGSHGEQDVHVMGFETTSGTTICNWAPPHGVVCLELNH
jgi:hypothetical protein